MSLNFSGAFRGDAPPDADAPPICTMASMPMALRLVFASGAVTLPPIPLWLQTWPISNFHIANTDTSQTSLQNDHTFNPIAATTLSLWSSYGSTFEELSEAAGHTA